MRKILIALVFASVLLVGCGEAVGSKDPNNDVVTLNRYDFHDEDWDFEGAYLEYLKGKLAEDVAQINGIYQCFISFDMDDNGGIKGVTANYLYDSDKISEDSLKKLNEGIKNTIQLNFGTEKEVSVMGRPLLEFTATDYSDEVKDEPGIKVMPYNFDEESNIKFMD